MSGNVMTATSGRVFIIGHNKVSPGDEEWDRYLAELEAFLERVGDVANARQLVVTVGGGPSVTQRSRVSNLMAKVDAGNALRTFVLSDSMMVRGIVTTMRWAGANMGAYPFGAIDRAARDATLTPDETVEATRLYTAVLAFVQGR